VKNFYKNNWQKLLEKDYFPSYLNSVQSFEFKDFQKIVLDENDKSKKLLNDVFTGDSLIIKNVFNKKEIIDLKDSIFDIENNQEEKNFRMLDECPNFHVSNKKNNIAPVKDNYDETAHSHYFFRWNKDEINIFQKFDKIWDLIKIFSGLEKDSYKFNKPKDLILDRIQIIRYPLNEGYITTHCDASAWQKLNIGICFNEQGKDFNEGGLYLLDKNDKKINIEGKLEIGDCFCWIPTIFHGVEIPKLTNHNKKNWKSKSGRWQALALTVQSHRVKNRLLSTGYERFKKDPIKFKEMYRNTIVE
tara:strand:- start:10 stop:915 length:906 start_codon:yes stop_codon:yes gene_type:complete